MGSYYCLMAGAPELTLADTNKGLTVEAFKEELEAHLTETDRKLLFFFFLKYDCRNLVRMLKNPQAEIDERGNFERWQLEDLITSARQINFNVHRYPAFMSVFAREFDYNKDKEGYFPEDQMALLYYEYAMKVPDSMMAEWFVMNLDITNILTALIARKYGWNVSRYIVGDTPVNEMLRTENAADFGLTHLLDFMPDLIRIVDCQDPVEKERQMDALKWNWLDEQTFLDPFNVDAVFAYLAKLDILERWAMLDVEEGKKTFTTIINNLRSEAQVPHEFTISGAQAAARAARGQLLE